MIRGAYLHGVSTRKVEDLIKALGADSGISKSEVSRICADLDEEVAAFRDRSLAEQALPYVFLDATYCKARVNRRVVSQPVVIAIGAAADGAARSSASGFGGPRVLDQLLGGSSWSSPMSTKGLKAAIGSVLLGASWQRCRVHSLRNVLAQVPKGNAEIIAEAIRTVFAHLRPPSTSLNRAVRPDRYDARTTGAEGRADDA